MRKPAEWIQCFVLMLGYLAGAIRRSIDAEASSQGDGGEELGVRFYHQRHTPKGDVVAAGTRPVARGRDNGQGDATRRTAMAVDYDDLRQR